MEQILGSQLTNDFGGFPNKMWNGLFFTEISKQGSKNKVCAKSLISKDIICAALSFSSGRIVSMCWGSAFVCKIFEFQKI